MSRAAAGMLLWCFFDLKRKAMMMGYLSDGRAKNTTRIRLGTPQYQTLVRIVVRGIEDMFSESIHDLLERGWKEEYIRREVVAVVSRQGGMNERQSQCELYAAYV
jgi:hypothetical protein